MYSHVSTTAPASTLGRPQAPTELEPLDSERFEHLTGAEAESLLASRFRSFTERGWDWKDALMLAVRPDQAAFAAPVPHSGDVSRH